MENKDSFDILIDYAEKHKLKYDNHRNASKHLVYGGAISPGDKFFYFEKDEFIFYATDSPMTTNTLTGLYTPIKLRRDFECTISKKDFLDFLVTKNKKKTGIKQIDEAITISSISPLESNFKISRESVEYFKDINKHFSAVKIVINSSSLKQLKEFKTKKILGLKTQDWIYQHKDIDLFLEKGQKLLMSILNDNKKEQII